MTGRHDLCEGFRVTPDRNPFVLHRLLFPVCAATLLCACNSSTPSTTTPPGTEPFVLEEATVADIHEAFMTLGCVIVSSYFL